MSWPCIQVVEVSVWKPQLMLIRRQFLFLETRLKWRRVKIKHFIYQCCSGISVRSTERLYIYTIIKEMWYLIFIPTELYSFSINFTFFYTQILHICCYIGKKKTSGKQHFTMGKHFLCELRKLFTIIMMIHCCHISFLNKIFIFQHTNWVV